MTTPTETTTTTTVSSIGILWGPGNGCPVGLWNVHGECVVEEPCSAGTGVISFLPCTEPVVGVGEPPVPPVPPVLPETGPADVLGTALIGAVLIGVGLRLRRFASI